MSETIDPYPLRWPSGFPRTDRPARSAFQVSANVARSHLLGELRRLGASDIVVTTNVAVRRDGLPYANQRGITDPGVAVWFVVGNQQRVIPCDRWNTIDDNIRAIGLTVAALRGLERWGARELVDRAFAGFVALPAGDAKLAWWEVLGVSRTATRAEVETAYRQQVRRHHPDAGGSADAFMRVKDAYETAIREVVTA